MKGKYSVNAKVGGKVPTNNATQMMKELTGMMKSTTYAKLPKNIQRKYAQAARDLARSQQSTSKAAINATRDTAVSLGSTYAATHAFEKSRDAELARSALNSRQSYDKALNEWNGVINLSPEEPYVEGEEGKVSGDATTGSVLGG